MPNALLTLNAGSSSIKFALFEIDGRKTPIAIARGEIESVNQHPRFLVRDAEANTLVDRKWHGDADFDELLQVTIGWAEERLAGQRLVAVGHRIVHGGRDHVEPELVNSKLMKDLEGLMPLAPLHQPHTLAPIRAVERLRGDLPQVVCFDTAFHDTMPDVAKRFALPREYEEAGIRRYGFHGLSYEYIASRLAENAPALAGGRVVVAHLGNGASLCALQAGRSVDTTMGFTALDGLVMGTRCGALDPGVVLYLLGGRGMTQDEVQDLLYRRSGLLGVSGGIASDMRTLTTSSDPRAREAVDLFVFRAAKETAALASSLGGIDGLVFTAGIGEHSAEIRAAVIKRLEWLGARLDADANQVGRTIISMPDSAFEIRVIPTDEESVIARHTLDTVSQSPRGAMPD